MIVHILINQIVALAATASKNKLDAKFMDALYELTIDDLIYLRDSYREEKI